MPNYRAYGLSIDCDLALPELPLAPATEAQPPADLCIRVSRASGPIIAAQEGGDFSISRQAALFAWPGVARVTLGEGRSVEVEADAGVSQGVLRAYLLGPVLAIALHQRGFLVLHAGAVALRDAGGEWGAVGFLGRSGEGKSTLAAAMHARGHRAVADDFIALPTSSMPSGAPDASSSSSASSMTAPMIFPGFARLRLSPQSLSALGRDADRAPLLHPEQDRRVWPVEERFGGEGLPLRRLYALQTGPDVRLEVLPPARAMPLLVQHSYCAGLLGPDEAAEQFRACAALARHLPVRLLRRPRDLALLDQVAALVEEDRHQRDQSRG